ncbi:hypothetical protein K1719_008785 [Acacia pycnantha]|nr:hypothetical protein K1719_008785 [Acacia pycnantha]
MSMFPELLRDAFPDADIPSSFYEAKKIINEIRLELPKIDAPQAYCMLYWGEDDRRETCLRKNSLRVEAVVKKLEPTKVVPQADRVLVRLDELEQVLFSDLSAYEVYFLQILLSYQMHTTKVGFRWSHQ